MSEIKVGEYVRTKRGIIGILEEQYTHANGLIEYPEPQEWVIKTLKGIYVVNESDMNDNIINHSKDIIELLEAGDYVNGYELSEFDDEEGNLYLGIPIYDDALMNSFTEIRPLNTIEIKSIVTKEQFEKVMYKVGE